MSTGDETNLIDDDHSAHLCDVGQRDYLAATVVRADGSAHLVLAQRDAIGDLDVRYDPDTAQAPHEQTGPLPLSTSPPHDQRTHPSLRPAHQIRLTVPHPSRTTRRRMHMASNQQPSKRSDEIMSTTKRIVSATAHARRPSSTSPPRPAVQPDHPETDPTTDPTQPPHTPNRQQGWTPIPTPDHPAAPTPTPAPGEPTRDPPPSRAALVCFHDDSRVSVELTFWRDVAEARQAELELTPCGPQCVGCHSIVTGQHPPAAPRNSAARQIS